MPVYFNLELQGIPLLVTPCDCSGALAVSAQQETSKERAYANQRRVGFRFGNCLWNLNRATYCRWRYYRGSYPSWVWTGCNTLE